MFDFIRKRINKTIKDSSEVIPEEELNETEAIGENAEDSQVEDTDDENTDETSDIDSGDSSKESDDDDGNEKDSKKENKSRFSFFRRNKDNKEEQTDKIDESDETNEPDETDKTLEDTGYAEDNKQEEPKKENKHRFSFFNKNKEDKTQADDSQEALPEENSKETAENEPNEEPEENKQEEPEKENKHRFSFFRRNKEDTVKDEHEEDNALKDKGIMEDQKATEENAVDNGNMKEDVIEGKAAEDEETPQEDGEGDKKEDKGHFGFLKRNKNEGGKKTKDPEDLEDDGGRFSFITKKTIKEDDIEGILSELELSLIEGDVAFDVADKIVSSVKEDLVGKKIKRRGDMELFTENALKKSIAEIIDNGYYDLLGDIEKSKQEGEPYKIMFVGINGTGKTTTIAKMAAYLRKHGYSSVFGASDTFRAGAIEQLEQHAKNLNLKIIKHERNSDPAAVAFDTVEHARAAGKDVVLIDTSGRMQTNTNLMDEMKKIKRVSKPDIVVYVGDALMGNDATQQAFKFNEVIDIDGIILTKADADAKGGAAISIGHVIHKPILFVGTGQSYDDLMEFKPEWMISQIFDEEASA